MNFNFYRIPAESACKLVAIFLGAIMAPVLLANLVFSLKYPESRYAWTAQVNGFMSIARPKSQENNKITIIQKFSV